MSKKMKIQDENMMRCCALRPIFLFLSLSILLRASGAPEHAVAETHAGAEDGHGAGICVDIDGQDSSGNCFDDSTAAATTGSSNLNLLLKEGDRALMEEKDFRRAISIFDDITLKNPDWDEMAVVQRSKGLALAQLGDGSKALWCFKNAMMLANTYPGKQKLQQLEANGYEMFAAQTSQLVQMTARNFWDKVHEMMGKQTTPDANLMYSTAQMAHAIGKVKEAKIMNDMLLKMEPNHGGARQLEVMMDLTDVNESSNPKEDVRRLRQVVQNYELFPWDATLAWGTIAGLECAIAQISNKCLNAWLKTFKYAASLSPIDKDTATKGVVNAANIMLKQQRPVKEVRKLGEQAVRLGLLNDPLQLPGELTRGVSHSAWRDDAKNWKAVRHLEENFDVIREEILAAYESGAVTRDAVLETENLSIAGQWRELDIFNNGIAKSKAWRILPRTAGIVMALRDANTMVMGGSKVSLMEPGTVVRPHTGRTNARLRIHMGISIPDGAFIRVNNETRTWTEGRCTVIDDSYVHEVWHNGDETRIVLIVDIWHPELDLERRVEGMTDPHALEMYRSMLEDPKMVLEMQGVPKAIIPDRFISEHDD